MNKSVQSMGQDVFKAWFSYRVGRKPNTSAHPGEATCIYRKSRQAVMIKTLFCTMIMALALNGKVHAQCKEWNWPEDRKVAEEKVALLQDAMKMKRYRQATKPLAWLITHAPQLNYSVYVHGINTYDALASREKIPARKKVYVDSLMLLYDLRLANCQDAENVLWRKANSSFTFLINGPEANRVLPIMDSVFYHIPGSASDGLLLRYMQATVLSHQKFKEPDQEGILLRYDILVGELEKRLKGASVDTKRTAALTKTRMDIDDWLFKVVKADCDFVRVNLAPRFEQNPTNLTLAKRIFAYMLAGKCTEDPLWLRSAIAIFEQEKDYALAKNIGIRYLNQQELEPSGKYLGMALSLSTGKKDSADVIYYLGIMESRTDKVASRKYFVKTLTLDPSRLDACERIGDLYYSSFEECANKKSQAEDRTVYIAAYQWYAKSGNAAKMKLAHQNFPSKEEIFLYNYKKGDRFHVNCWINEDIVFQTRD